MFCRIVLPKVRVLRNNLDSAQELTASIDMSTCAVSNALLLVWIWYYYTKFEITWVYHVGCIFFVCHEKLHRI